MTTGFPRHLLLAALAVSALPSCRRAGTPPPQDLPVTVAVVERRDVPVVVEATGSAEPVQTVAVEAQVGGILNSVEFSEGGEVREGQVLFQLDPRPYRAILAQAEGILARDVAQFDAAKRDLDRSEELAAQQFVTIQERDQARGKVGALAATLAADTAQVEQARLDLQNATIRAPITGRAGGLLVKRGNLVKANAPTPLVVINQISPIQVRFAVPATYLADIRRRAGHDLPVRATPVGDGTAATQLGQLVFIDNAVDSLTGTIQLKAAFANSDRVLWPGGLVRVVLELDMRRGALVVPMSAVVNSQQGSTVYLVGADHKVSIRPVRVDQTSDTLAVLLAGVQAGDTVVTDGQLRLTEGATVAPRTMALPADRP
jgi:membrane fusion protein, multidrug efflux system